MKNFKILFSVICLFYGLNLSAKTIAQDTLHLVREDDFLRYPLGTSNSFRSFENAHKELISSTSDKIKVYRNGSTAPTKMFALQKSYARFYPDKNTKKLELINSIILGNEIPLQNGVIVGMERAAFFKKMNIPDENAMASTVEITSKTAGIIHFYQFTANKLISIKIFSNLFYQKD